jgi:hypothetical protein
VSYYYAKNKKNIVYQFSELCSNSSTIFFVFVFFSRQATNCLIGKFFIFNNSTQIIKKNENNNIYKSNDIINY